MRNGEERGGRQRCALRDVLAWRAASALHALLLINAATGQCLPEQQTELASAHINDGDGFGSSVAISGNTVVVGAPFDDQLGNAAGAAHVFVRDGEQWVFQATLTAGAIGAPGDQFGGAVAIDGDTIIVGARFETTNGFGTGAAYAFTRTNSIWTFQDTLDRFDSQRGDFFGVSVSVSGDTAIIGAFGEDQLGDTAGAAYVFTRSDSTWMQQQKLTGNDLSGGECFGFSVSVEGDTVAIGAYGDNQGGSFAGAAYVFTRAGTAWSQQQKIVPLGVESEDFFANSVSLDADTLLAGAHGDDDGGQTAGAAYVYVRSETTWQQQAKMIAVDGSIDDEFGRSVSIQGDNAVVSAPLDDDGGRSTGSLYIFQRDGTIWSEILKLSPDDAGPEDSFGASVSVDARVALAGAPGHDDFGSNAGSAYVIEMSCSSTCEADMFPEGGGDGTVGPGDLGELLANWGSCPGCSADLFPASNGDGDVGPGDLAELLASWGPCKLNG